jgi:hypothetical protein
MRRAIQVYLPESVPRLQAHRNLLLYVEHALSAASHQRPPANKKQSMNYNELIVLVVLPSHIHFLSQSFLPLPIYFSSFFFLPHHYFCSDKFVSILTNRVLSLLLPLLILSRNHPLLSYTDQHIHHHTQRNTIQRFFSIMSENKKETRNSF